MTIPEKSKAITKLPAIPEPTATEEGRAATLNALKSAMDVLVKNAAGLEGAGVFVRVADYSEIKNQITAQIDQALADPQGATTEQFNSLMQMSNDLRALIDEETRKAREEFDAAVKEIEDTVVAMLADFDTAQKTFDDLVTRVETDGEVLYDINATLGPNGATFKSTVLTEVNTTSALAGKVDKLISRVGDSSASLKDEIVTYVDTDTSHPYAIAGRVQAVETTLGNGGATFKDSILSEVDLGTTRPHALAGRVQTVETTLGENGASLKSAIITEVTTNTAMATNVNNLVSRVGTGSASFTDEILTKVDDGTTSSSRPHAIAGRVQTIENILGPAGATIKESVLTTVDNNSALAGRVGTIETTYAKGSDVYSKSTIDTQFLAKSGLDSALATQKTTVGTTLNGVSNTASQALTSINGMGAEWRVKFDQTGGELRLSGATKTVNGVTTNQNLFYIRSNVQIEGDLLIDGSILRGKVGTGEISQVWHIEAPSYITGNGGWLEAAKLTFNLPIASTVVVMSFAQQDYLGGTLPSAVSEHYINGVLLGGASTGTGFVASSVAMMGAKDVSAGSTTILFRWKGGDSNVLAGARSLIAFALYR